MSEISPSEAEIAEALVTPVDLKFDLPDPEDDEIEELEFEQKLGEI